MDTEVLPHTPSTNHQPPAPSWAEGLAESEEFLAELRKHWPELNTDLLVSFKIEISGNTPVPIIVTQRYMRAEESAGLMRAIEAFAVRRVTPDAAHGKVVADVSRLPPSYADAELRAVIPLCEARGRLGVAFDVGQSVLRLAVDEASARSMRDSLSNYLNRVHSGKSGEMPQAPGSTPLLGEKV